MEKTIEVIKLIADKYRNKVNAIISEDTLIIEYLYEIDGEKDVFKSIKLKEENGILYANIYPYDKDIVITLIDLEKIFKEIEEEIISKKKSKQNTNQEERYKDYLSMFDKLFDTDAKEHIDFKKMKLLKSFHNYFTEEIYEPSTEYKRIRKDFVVKADSLREQLTDKQIETFDKVLDLCNQLTAEQDEQSFVFGVIMGHKLKLELTDN